MNRLPIGHDLSKWLIHKSTSAAPGMAWAVLPPFKDGKEQARGGFFATGAEALAAFAQGGAS